MDEEAYAARVEAAKDDAIELGRIADELQIIGGMAANRLRIRAIAFRFKLKSKNLTVTPKSWLAQLGLGAVDGRSLYRLSINDNQFNGLQEKLIARKLALSSVPSRDLAGQFVLWAAEWFRRSYDGTGQRWDALGQVLGITLEQYEWRRLADEGMAFWRLPAFKLNGIHHRLAAIARQGGFPIAAIEADGWAARFLEALVASLAAMPPTDIDGAVAVADRLIGPVPETWRSRELRVVAAELAVEVVRLRRLAEADGVAAGALVSAWLDNHAPDWRDNLPLSVSSAAARTLIDGLLRVIPLRGGHEAVRCVRWLEIGMHGRRQGVELHLAGLLRDGSGKVLTDNMADQWSRLRLFASGQFAQHVAGELAVADPDDDGVWRARPSMTRSRFELDNSVPIPSGLAITTTRIGDWIEVRLVGWPHSASAAAVARQEPNCWRLPAKANRQSTLCLTLAGAAGGSFEILVPLRHQAWIESWRDGPLQRNATFSLSTINQYVARAERCELMADLVDRNKREVPQGRASWWVDGELPLSAIRDDLAALLRPCGDIGYQVKLNFNDGNEDYWWVGEFEHELIEERGGFVARPAIADEGVRIVRRPLHEPALEEDCGAFGLMDSIQHRPLILPRQQGRRRGCPFLAMAPSISIKSESRPSGFVTICQVKPAISQARRPARKLSWTRTKFRWGALLRRACAKTRRTSPGASTRAERLMGSSLSGSVKPGVDALSV